VIISVLILAAVPLLLLAFQHLDRAAGEVVGHQRFDVFDHGRVQVALVPLEGQAVVAALVDDLRCDLFWQPAASMVMMLPSLRFAPQAAESP